MVVVVLHGPVALAFFHACLSRHTVFLALPFAGFACFFAPHLMRDHFCSQIRSLAFFVAALYCRRFTFPLFFFFDNSFSSCNCMSFCSSFSYSSCFLFFILPKKKRDSAVGGFMTLFRPFWSEWGFRDLLSTGRVVACLDKSLHLLIIFLFS